MSLGWVGVGGRWQKSVYWPYSYSFICKRKNTVHSKASFTFIFFFLFFQTCSEQSEIQFWSDLNHQGVDIPKAFLFPLFQDVSELVFSCGSIGSLLLGRTMTRACGITIALHSNCHSERWCMHSLSHLVAMVASWPGHPGSSVIDWLMMDKAGHEFTWYFTQRAS